MTAVGYSASIIAASSGGRALTSGRSDLCCSCVASRLTLGPGCTLSSADRVPLDDRHCAARGGAVGERLQPEAVPDRRGKSGLVERIEVQSGGAAAQQVIAETRDDVEAERAYRGGI